MMQVDGTEKTQYSMTYFDYLSAYCKANNINDTTDKKFFLIDRSAKDFPPGYDHYFLDSGSEFLASIGAAGKFVTENKADLMVGSFLHELHPLYHRTISWPADLLLCLTWYTSPFYFTSYFFKKQQRDKNLTFINGQNRSIRNYFLDHVGNHMDKVISNDKSIRLSDLDDFCSDADRNFVEYCNSLYDIDRTPEKHVSTQEITFGIDGKFGNTRASFIPLPEYFTSRCVVYPETSFHNYSAFPTEKTWKCVKAKTHWIFYGGARSYEIMRELGFRSIVELCPDHINDFDGLEDHVMRIEKISKCCEYISNNNGIFDSNDAKDILETNYENFHNPHMSLERSLQPFIDRYLGEK